MAENEQNDDIEAKSEIAAIAMRCLHEADFAAEVLAGDRYPEVREAIAADLAAGEAEVEGFQDVPPSPFTGGRAGLVGPTEGPRPVIEGNNVWATLPRPRLTGLAGPPGLPR